MAKANQTLFIPERIRRLRLSKLPLSAELASALGRLRIVTFDDLTGVSFRNFQRVSNTASALFVEIERLIQRARQGDFAPPAGQYVPAKKVYRHSRCTGVPGRVANSDRRAKSGPITESPQDETIFIPLEAHGKLLAAFPLSPRLMHILQFKHFRLLGDLHGRSFSEIRGYRNCGKKTIEELRELVRAIQHSHHTLVADGKAEVVVYEAPPPMTAGTILVPMQLHDLNVADLPLSVRLEGVLKRKEVQRLGDVHGLPAKGIRNFGRKTISELVRLIERAAAGEFSAAPDVAWNPVEMVRTLDALVADLPDRNEEVLVQRLGGRSEDVPTLEELGKKFRLTRERVRQIAESSVEHIRKQGGPRLRNHLEHVERTCCEKVLPITPDLLQQWVRDSLAAAKFRLPFYVRLLAELNPAIPAWPAGQDTSASRMGHSEEIERGLEAVLREGFQSVPLTAVLSQLRSRAGLRKIEATEFLSTLQHSQRFKVEFPQPDAPVVRLTRRSALDVARAVLRVSDSPLTPEEILARAHSIVGADAARWNPRTLGNTLVEEKGFYLLGPRSYGLRQHFALPEQTREQVKADFRELLKQQNRPVSTAEVVNLQRFKWAEQTNTYELACIVREDDRLIDLGKFLFALVEWGIEEREYVKDLIPKVLHKAGRPLTGTEVLARLQQLRSIANVARN